MHELTLKKHKHPRLKRALSSIVLLLFACTSGSGGSGSVDGIVNAPECNLHMKGFNLEPNFFAAAPSFGNLEIRIQNSSDFEDLNDGITVFINDASEIKANPGKAWPVGNTAQIRMALYLNATCPSYPISRMQRPVFYQAVEGHVIFDKIYAPKTSAKELEIVGHFENVRFTDPGEPKTRFAILSGRFSFLFSRGRPGQRFP